MEAFHFPFRTPLFPSPFIAPSTKATLWFDLISNRDLGLVMNASLLWNTCIELCASIIFLFTQERKVLEAFLRLIRRLPLLYDKIEQLRRCMKLCSPPFLFGVRSSL